MGNVNQRPLINPYGSGSKKPIATDGQAELLLEVRCGRLRLDAVGEIFIVLCETLNRETWSSISSRTKKSLGFPGWRVSVMTRSLCLKERGGRLGEPYRFDDLCPLVYPPRE